MYGNDGSLTQGGISNDFFSSLARLEVEAKLAEVTVIGALNVSDRIDADGEIKNEFITRVEGVCSATLKVTKSYPGVVLIVRSRDDFNDSIMPFVDLKSRKYAESKKIDDKMDNSASRDDIVASNIGYI